MYDYETLKVERNERILTVTLNRPDVLNATNPKMHQELVDIFPKIDADPNTNVVVITGEGKAFSAGGDIKRMQQNLDNHARWLESMEEARAILYGLVDLSKPVIAKLNGHAIGFGATLALFCDIVIASDKAKLGDPHVNVGLVCGDGGSLIWPALIGFNRAKRYLLTGDTIDASEAAAIGLITEAVPSDELAERVDTLVRQIAKQPPVALRLTKKSVNMRLRQLLDTLIEAHLGYETMSHLSADHAEAVNAFAEGRAPNFTAE